MAQVFGLLIVMVIIIVLSFILSVGVTSLICYAILYSRFKSWKYYKRCILFTFLGGCVGVFITYVFIPSSLDSKIIPYVIIFFCMFVGGFGILATKIEL